MGKDWHLISCWTCTHIQKHECSPNNCLVPIFAHEPCSHLDPNTVQTVSGKP